MTESRFYAAISIFLVLLLGYLTYQILQPFLNSIAWAVVFAIVFYPLYLFFLKLLKVKAVASTVTVLIIILTILGPFTYLSFSLIDEIGNSVDSINKGALDSVKSFFTYTRITKLVYKLQSYFGIEGIVGREAIAENIKFVGKAVSDRLSSGLTNIAGMLIDFIFMLLAVFFFFKDGPNLLSRIREYLPFSEENKNRLILRIKDMVISTVYGGVVIAIIQGVLGGSAFYFLGIKSPVLWGSAMSIMSFLPLLGTFSIWGPAAGYLFAQGSLVKGVVLLLYGVFVISMVDNILRPIIISGRTKMPALVVFFSVLGGIKLFGVVGFIMGPLVMALFVSVFEMFKHTEGGQNAQ